MEGVDLVWTRDELGSELAFILGYPPLPGLVHSGTVLLAAQLLATCLVVPALAACGFFRIHGSQAAALRWAPTGATPRIALRHSAACVGSQQMYQC